MRSNVKAKHDHLATAELERCARQCSAIGDPTKLKICYLLNQHQELNVSTIAEQVGTTVSNASHSLNKLRDCGLVTSRKDGKTVYYSLTDGCIAQALLEFVT